MPTQNNAQQPRKGATQPPPEAEYGDSVSIEQLAKLKKSVEPLNLEEWETVSGPAW
jgi:hypothetical protein